MNNLDQEIVYQHVGERIC